MLGRSTRERGKHGNHDHGTATCSALGQMCTPRTWIAHRAVPAARSITVAVIKRDWVMVVDMVNVAAL